MKRGSDEEHDGARRREMEFFVGEMDFQSSLTLSIDPAEDRPAPKTPSFASDHQNGPGKCTKQLDLPTSSETKICLIIFDRFLKRISVFFVQVQFPKKKSPKFVILPFF